MLSQDCTIDLIVSRQVNAHVVFEDDTFIAFLDNRPLFVGHTLLAPKEHFQTFFDVPETLISPLFNLTQKIGKAVQIALHAEGIFIAMNNVISQSIPHLHIHIVPRNKKDGLKGFFWPRSYYENETHMRNVKDTIKAVLDKS